MEVTKKVAVDDSKAREARYRALFEKDRNDHDRALQSAIQSYESYSDEMLLGHAKTAWKQTFFFDPRIIDALIAEMRKRGLKEADGLQEYMDSIDYLRPWMVK